VVKHLAKVKEQAIVLENLPTKDTSPDRKFRCPIKFLHANELKTVKPGEAQWLVNSSPASGKYALALTPGKTGRLPASDGGTVSFVVERPFETASDLMTGPYNPHIVTRAIVQDKSCLTEDRYCPVKTRPSSSK
jgi:hypothetical protein